MNEYQKRWVEALRSGDYQQGKGFLHNQDNNTFCCLGVACHVLAKDLEVPIDSIPKGSGRVTRWGDQIGSLPIEIAQALNISTDGGLNETVVVDGEMYDDLIMLNDDAGYTFEQIANLIEVGMLREY